MNPPSGTGDGRPGAGDRPDPGSSSADSDLDPIDVLAAEYTERLRSGAAPAISEYADRHPSLAAEIRDLFPTIAAMERLKETRRLGSDSGVSLGNEHIERLGDYRILREIGRGGMGIVYEAEQESLGRRVAVKVLPRQSLLDPKHLRRFEREARMAAGLHHTNIVPVFGVGDQEGHHYYVMQLIDGVGLDKVVERLRSGARPGEPAPAEPGAWVPPSGRRYWQAVATIGVQAAEALEYAHSRGVLHRDIKPGNLLVDSSGVVWVTDFGLAKIHGQEDVSQAGDVVGTLRYLAPEQLEGRVDARSDIYGLGLTLYELLALRAAFDEADRAALLKRISQGGPPAPRRLRPEIPVDLETIVLKATSRDPGHRYPSAGELAEDLRRFVEDRPIHARRIHPIVRLWRWAKRERLVAGLAGAAALLLVLVSAVTSVAYVRTRQAMDGEWRERTRAEAVSKLATDVLDGIFERFAPGRTVAASDMTLEGSEGEEIEVAVQPVLSREAAALLDRLLGFYERLAAEHGEDAGLREKTADAHRRVGDIRQRLGDVDEARTAYRNALESYEALRGSAPGEARFAIEIARIHNDLGRTAPAAGLPANDSFLEALSVLESVPSEGQRAPSYRYELARTLYLLGKMPSFQTPMKSPEPDGRPGARGPGPSDDRARERRRWPWEWLGDAVRILDELVREHPAIPEYRQLQALCYRDMEPFSRPSDGPGEPPGEQRPRDRAVEILRQLVEDFPGVPDYRFDLADTLASGEGPWPFWFGPGPDRRGGPPAGDRPDPRPRLTEAAAILSDLVARHPNVPDYASAQVLTLLKLGGAEGAADDVEAAERALERAAATQEMLAARFPEVPPYTEWLGWIQRGRADCLEKLGRTDDALAALDDALVTFEILLAEAPTQGAVEGPWDKTYRSARGNLADAYQARGRLLAETGDAEGAEAAFRNELFLRELRDDRGGRFGPGSKRPSGPPDDAP